MITGAIQNIIIHIIPIVIEVLTSMVIDMLIHTGMGLRMDTNIIMVGIIMVGIIMAGIENVLTKV